MTNTKPAIAVIGAGIGGLAVSAKNGCRDDNLRTGIRVRSYWREDPDDPERDPLPKWSDGYVVLARCLAHGMANGGKGEIPAAFAQFEAARKPRTSMIQATSHRNDYMRVKTDPDWVYSYDAWSVELPGS